MATLRLFAAAREAVSGRMVLPGSTVAEVLDAACSLRLDVRRRAGRRLRCGSTASR
ncbi:MAG: hypothetical protein R2699_19420 [Acidimicrobiales bacterium]